MGWGGLGTISRKVNTIGLCGSVWLTRQKWPPNLCAAWCPTARAGCVVAAAAAAAAAAESNLL